MFLLGEETASETNASFLSPDEAWAIDRKIDDGLPQQGSVWGFNWNTCTDAAAAATPDAAYDLDGSESTSSKSCALMFRVKL